MDSATSKVTQYGDSKVIRIPQIFFSDSAFPFKIGEKVTLRIEGNKIIVESSK